MANSETAPHVLVFPFPEQGHMLPLLDLAHQLVIRGLSVTVLVSADKLPLLSPLLSRSPTVQTLVLPFLESDNPSPNFFSKIQSLTHLHVPILNWAHSLVSPPTAIISDFFLGWTNRLAAELRIPRLVFSPSSALTTSVIDFMWREMPWREDPLSTVSFPSLPNSPTYPWYQLPRIYNRLTAAGDPVLEFVKETFFANMQSWGIVFNSFAGLEGEYLDHVRRDLGHERVWAVGPLSPIDGPEGRGGASSVPVGDVLTWLDRCEEGSVVYVCFGSLVVLSPPQAEAVAAGLERSGARFVWCVKGSTVVPEGFEERVVGRGIVIKGWAPQVALLGHRAVGAFLTHCGWNSVLEGISAGVPLLMWPLWADQFLNARLLVEEKGVAERVCERVDAVPDPDELARVFAESVGEARGEKAKKAGELRRKALDAVKEGGSSFRDLDGLVEQLVKVKVNLKEDVKSE